MRVLDLAGGEGRHAIAAAARGADVLLVDRDSAALETATTVARALGVAVRTRVVDLERPWPDFGVFDAVLVFNYLDRSRMDSVRAAVAPGGLLILETFLEAQRTQGWGPDDPAHLLRAGELARLVAPLSVLHGREALEPVEGNRWRAIASVVARNIR
ncbi:MAG TPA: class I SAM-dependent methyltransferase [Gemmatimonadales bacterium]|nr:class I SAM-dependent methyltransferase [Gemmatimonadales bacterium]